MPYTIPNAAQWPDVLKRERSVRWMPDFGNETSPPALDGTRQFRNTNGGGLWRAAFIGGQLTRREHVLAWMATEVVLRGGMTPVDVPFCGYRPRRINPSVAIVAKAEAGGWAARATSGVIAIARADDLVPGMHFSDFDGGSGGVYGWRLYRIETAITGETILDTGFGAAFTAYSITFWPPARKAVADDHVLEIEEPRCVMRLAASDSMDLELELRKRGNPNAEFIEA